MLKRIKQLLRLLGPSSHDPHSDGGRYAVFVRKRGAMIFYRWENYWSGAYKYMRRLQRQGYDAQMLDRHRAGRLLGALRAAKAGAL